MSMERMSVTRFSFHRKGSKRGKDKDPADGFDFESMSYISQQEAKKIDDDLFNEHAYSVSQLMEVAGLSCAYAIAKYYPLEKQSRDNGALLVCCGPGLNGGDGLVCARHLKAFGYKPTLFYPKHTNKPLYKNLTTQAERMDIPFLSFLPSDPSLLKDSYNFIVDAVLGFGIKPHIKDDFLGILETLKKVDLPIISLDIPSGWDIESGDPEGIQPETLISISVPKKCAKTFEGKYHILAGRFIPPSLAQKYNLKLPPYSGPDLIVEIRRLSEKEKREKEKMEQKEKEKTEKEKESFTDNAKQENSLEDKENKEN